MFFISVGNGKNKMWHVSFAYLKRLKVSMFTEKNFNKTIIFPLKLYMPCVSVDFISQMTRDEFCSTQN